MHGALPAPRTCLSRQGPTKLSAARCCLSRAHGFISRLAPTARMRVVSADQRVASGGMSVLGLHLETPLCRWAAGGGGD